MMRDNLVETDIQAAPQLHEFLPVAATWHTAVILGATAVLSYRGHLRADQMRAVVNPNRIGMYESTIFFECLMLLLVLAGVWLNGSSVFSVLGERWRSFRQFIRDFEIGLAFLIGSIMITSIIGSHGGTGDKATQFLLPRGGVETALWIVLSITAGICEEAIYRGYLQKQFMALTKSAAGGIVLSALTFAAAHSYQGFSRASLIGVLGAMSGVLAFWCRSVRPGMIAHALQDVLGAFIRH
jgi:membrane protease YdiL (CAAX protease family)